MQIITTLDELNQAVLPPSAAALGTFDGLHRGHQKVIHTTRAYAKEHGLSSLVFTFSNHPLAFLKPEKEPPRLLSNPDQIFPQTDFSRSLKTRAYGPLGLGPISALAPAVPGMWTF